MITENISTLKIHKLTQAQYDRELEAGNIDPNALYLTPDEANNLGDYTETDPTVPSWAKQPTKPTYTASEVGALPNTTVIPTVPTNVSAFTNDAEYVTQEQLDAIDWFGTGISIPNNSDLNNYTTPGKYYVGSTSSAATITNAPVTNTNYSLYVFTRTNSKSITQLIIGLNNKIYLRSATANGDLSEWMSIASLNELNTEIQTLKADMDGNHIYVLDLEDMIGQMINGVTINTLYSERSLTWDGCIDNREYIVDQPEGTESRLVAVRIIDDIPDAIYDNMQYFSSISPIITIASSSDNSLFITPGIINPVELIPNVAYGYVVRQYAQNYPNVMILLEDTTIPINDIPVEVKKGIYFLAQQELTDMGWISRTFTNIFAIPPLDISPKSLEKHIEIELFIPNEQLNNSSITVTRTKGKQKTIETHSLTAEIVCDDWIVNSGRYIQDYINFTWNDLRVDTVQNFFQQLMDELETAKSFKIILNNKHNKLRGISHSYGFDNWRGMGFDFGPRLFVRLSSTGKDETSEPV